MRFFLKKRIILRDIRSIPVLGLILFFINVGLGQHQDLQEKPKIWQNDGKTSGDTTNILAAFKAGTFNGHFRYFFSSTINKGELSDYVANAVGGGLRYETASFYHFKVGVSGFYIFNAGSSHLAGKDELSGQSNRYEIGLFDVTDPENLSEINRLEEFFIKYQVAKIKVTFGRQLLNTPFINLQDGRMRPTAVEGLWIESDFHKNHQIQLGWLNAVAPRSTSKWYGVGESIGIYPSGVDTKGQKSNYADNVITKGVLLANYQAKFDYPLIFNVWNMWVESVLNNTMLQADWEQKLKSGKLYAGIQGSGQTKSGNGGNNDPSKVYYTNSSPVYTYGTRIGWKNMNWDYSLNFNRISASGRYLNPREWGRDYFFTFMPRERNEGFGDVTAFLAKVTYTYNRNSSIQLAAGTFDLPDVKNVLVNKYGMPSYYQLNIDVRHKFTGALNGFEAQILWVSKFRKGETYNEPRYIIHKVDMNLLNVVLNFRF